jgi:hypothetical protein
MSLTKEGEDGTTSNGPDLDQWPDSRLMARSCVLRQMRRLAGHSRRYGKTLVSRLQIPQFVPCPVDDAPFAHVTGLFRATASSAGATATQRSAVVRALLPLRADRTWWLTRARVEHPRSGEGQVNLCFGEARAESFALPLFSPRSHLSTEYRVFAYGRLRIVSYSLFSFKRFSTNEF